MRVVETVAGLVGTLALAVGLVWWRLASGGIEVPTLRGQMEREIAQFRGGRPVSIESVRLSWSDGALVLRATGVRALTEKGAVLSRTKAVIVGLNLPKLLRGQVSVVNALFDGGAVTVRQLSGGATEIAFGPPGAPADIVLPPSPQNESLAQAVDRMLDGLVATMRPVGPGGDLRSLRLRNGVLTIADDRGGVWRANDAAAALTRKGTALTLSVSASLTGPRGDAPINLNVRTDTTFDAASVEFDIKGARASALAPADRLGPLAGLDAPISVSILAGLDRQRGITRFDGAARMARGQLVLGGGALALDGGAVRGRYDFAKDELLISEATIAGFNTRFKGVARIRHASSLFSTEENAAAQFDLTLDTLDLDMPGAFARPVTVSAVNASGVIHPAEPGIDIAKFVIAVPGSEITGSAGLVWAPDSSGRLRLGVKAQAEQTGALDPQTVLSFWPLRIAAGARDWLGGALLHGRIFNAMLKADIAPGGLGAALTPEQLALDFDFDQARISILERMSPITDGVGRGALHGNSFELWGDVAALNGLSLTKAHIAIPNLTAPDAVATIDAHGEGEARALIATLQQALVDMDARLPFDPGSIVGSGAVDLTLSKPLHKRGLSFKYRGAFEDVGGSTRDGKIKLSQWRLKSSGNDDGLTFSGPLLLGQSPANVTWTEDLRHGAAHPSNLVAQGKIDAADLAQMGYPADIIATGPIGVDLRMSGAGAKIAQASVKLDLRQAAAFLPRNLWRKPAGRAAEASFQVWGAPDGGLSITGLDVQGGGLTANGTLRTLKDGRLAEVHMPRLAVEGRTDVALTALRTPAGVLDVAITGASLDIGPALAPQPQAATAPPPAEPGPTSLNASEIRRRTPLNVRVNVDRLQLQGGRTLNGVRLLASTDGKWLTALSLRGMDPMKKPFSLDIAPQSGAPARTIRFASSDAGFAMAGVTGGDNIVGGEVEASGEYLPGQPARADFTLRMRNFRVVKLPAMARLLNSFGSFRGIAGMMNDKGVEVTALEAPMVYQAGKISLGESRASGPTMAMTAKGAIDLTHSTIDIAGVMAPAYGLNSVLGEVPVLGELFVGRKGEGVVGMTFSLQGPAQSAKVAVNPLSALTPGFLRRIFELGGRGAEPAAEAAPP